MKKAFLLYLVVINLVSFILVAKDKRIAERPDYHSSEHRQNRIAECDFLSLAAFGGAAGTLIGFRATHHKVALEKAYLRRAVRWMLVQNTLMIFVVLSWIKKRQENKLLKEY